MTQPFTVALVSLYVIENSGIRLLAAFLRRQGIRVVEVYFKDWINNALSPPSEPEIANLLSVLRESGAGLIGLSVRASGYHRVAALLTDRIRSGVGAPIIWGGLHPTCVPEDCIPHADMLCLGEGEAPMLELVRTLSSGRAPTGIRNLWIRTAAGVERNPLRPLVQDLDSLPFRDFQSPDKYVIAGRRVTRGDPYVSAPIFQITASVGCPFATCSFCGNTILRRLLAENGPYYRQRSVGHVIGELRGAREHFPNLRTVRFDDGIFGYDRAWVREFAAAYKAQVGLPFSCMADPRVVDREWIELLTQAGLSEVFMGIQNTERVNRVLYRRPISNRQVLDVARLIHDFRLKASYHLVLDDPISTPEDKRDLFDFVLQLPRPLNLFLFSMTVFPRSPLAEQLLEQGLIEESGIEGKDAKIFRQWRVDLRYPRPPEDTFWAALLVLASKRLVPRAALRRLARSERLKQRPRAVVAAAVAANVLKMPWMALRMLVRGEINGALLRRWISDPRAWVTA